jgi:hypothetical protein
LHIFCFREVIHGTNKLEIMTMPKLVMNLALPLMTSLLGIFFM